jgi:hypothetical protein
MIPLTARAVVHVPVFFGQRTNQDASRVSQRVPDQEIRSELLLNLAEGG